MSKKEAQNIFEIVPLPEDQGRESGTPDNALLELLLAKYPADDLVPIFQEVFRYCQKKYNYDYAFCASIHHDVKGNIVSNGLSGYPKDQFFRMNWSCRFSQEKNIRDEVGPVLTVSKEAETLFIKGNGRYFLRIYLGDKEGQEYYYFLTSPTGNMPGANFVLQVQKFLRARFELSAEFESLNKFKALVYVDDVTGLYNQRKLVKDLEILSKKYEETKAPFTVLFIDIDHFKKVNDGHGHLVGTLLLAEMAKLLRRILRESDLVYRYGGDEFVMIVPNSDPEHAKKIAERILRAVKKEEFLKSAKGPFKLSVSIGVAGVPNHAKAPHELLEMADQMMYTAKSSGRGKVCMAGELFE